MTPRQARLGVDVFTGAVIVSVGLAMAGLTWRLAGYSGVGPAVAPVLSGSSSSIDIKPVIALAPFGSAVTTPAQGGDGPIRLRAIFLAVPASASTVLIAGADGKVVSYGLGQSVGGGVIEAIQAEQILLRMPGGARTIGFNPEGLAAAAPNALSSQGKAQPSGEGSASVMQPGQAGSAALSGVDAIRALIPPELRGKTAPAQNALPNAQAPPSAGTSGYVVGASVDPAILAAGVKPGDVIESVNGAPVSAGVNQRGLIAQALAAGSARLVILRGGQRVSLTVPVR